MSLLIFFLSSVQPRAWSVILRWQNTYVDPIGLSLVHSQKTPTHCIMYRISISSIVYFALLLRLFSMNRHCLSVDEITDSADDASSPLVIIPSRHTQQSSHSASIPQLPNKMRRSRIGKGWECGSGRFRLREFVVPPMDRIVGGGLAWLRRKAHRFYSRRRPNFCLLINRSPATATTTTK